MKLFSFAKNYLPVPANYFTESPKKNIPRRWVLLFASACTYGLCYMDKGSVVFYIALFAYIFAIGFVSIYLKTFFCDSKWLWNSEDLVRNIIAMIVLLFLTLPIIFWYYIPYDLRVGYVIMYAICVVIFFIVWAVVALDL